MGSVTIKRASSRDGKLFWVTFFFRTFWVLFGEINFYFYYIKTLLSFWDQSRSRERAAKTHHFPAFWHQSVSRSVRWSIGEGMDFFTRISCGDILIPMTIYVDALEVYGPVGPLSFLTLSSATFGRWAGRVTRASSYFQSCLFPEEQRRTGIGDSSSLIWTIIVSAKNIHNI